MHDFACLLQRHALLLAKFGILRGELVTQLTGARVEDRGGGEVNTEFGCAGTYLGLIAEDGQVGHRPAQQSAGGAQDAVVVTFGQDDALAVGACTFHQLVGEHLRGRHGGDRNRKPLQQVADVDVAVHQRDRGVDLALRGGRNPAAGAGDRAGGFEGTQVGSDHRQPKPQTGNQFGDAAVQGQPAVENDGRQ